MRCPRTRTRKEAAGGTRLLTCDWTVRDALCASRSRCCPRLTLDSRGGSLTPPRRGPAVTSAAEALSRGTAGEGGGGHTSCPSCPPRPLSSSRVTGRSCSSMSRVEVRAANPNCFERDAVPINDPQRSCEAGHGDKPGIVVATKIILTKFAGVLGETRWRGRRPALHWGQRSLFNDQKHRLRKCLFGQSGASKGNTHTFL